MPRLDENLSHGSRVWSPEAGTRGLLANHSAEKESS